MGQGPARETAIHTGPPLHSTGPQSQHRTPIQRLITGHVSICSSWTQHSGKQAGTVQGHLFLNSATGPSHAGQVRGSPLGSHKLKGYRAASVPQECGAGAPIPTSTGHWNHNPCPKCGWAEWPRWIGRPLSGEGGAGGCPWPKVEQQENSLERGRNLGDPRWPFRAGHHPRPR